MNRSPYSWGDLNIALNRLVREGVIVAYKTNCGDRNAQAAMIEVTVAAGTDQAEIVGLVTGSVPPAFAEATVRTRDAI